MKDIYLQYRHWFHMLTFDFNQLIHILNESVEQNIINDNDEGMTANKIRDAEFYFDNEDIPDKNRFIIINRSALKQLFNELRDTIFYKNETYDRFIRFNSFRFIVIEDIDQIGTIKLPKNNNVTSCFAIQNEELNNFSKYYDNMNKYIKNVDYNIDLGLFMDNCNYISQQQVVKINIKDE